MEVNYIKLKGVVQKWCLLELVSAYSLTFSKPKLDQINQKLTNNAKECVFLCL
jgi:hypothetical protein